MSSIAMPTPEIILLDKKFQTEEVKYFKKAGNRFLEHGAYTNAPKNTIAYKEFWQEERDKCINGDTYNGTRITGEHYFYLNYCPIMMFYEGEQYKREGLPYFYDYDFYYFEKIEEAVKKRKGIVLLKGRRKGFSFKSASLLTHRFTFVKNSSNFIGSYFEEYAQQTFDFSVNMLDFLLRHTAFGKKRIINKENHKKAGYKLANGAIAGTGNEMKFLTFNKNPSKALGKSATFFLFEEVGKWENLMESYLLTEPLLKEGNKFIGLPILQGTAGDMSSGITPFAEFFFNPAKYNMLAIDNGDKKETGLFFPAYYGHNGIYGDADHNVVKELYGKPMIDEAGNSNIALAMLDIQEKKELLLSSGDIKANYIYTTENPCKPEDAFMVVSSGYFNHTLLSAQLAKVKTYREYEPQTGKLEWEIINGVINYNKVMWIPDPNGKIKIWEHPKTLPQEKSPYYSGIDSFDLSVLKKKVFHSDGAMLVYKGIHKPLDASKDMAEWHKETPPIWNGVVCEYVDRPVNPEEFYEETLKINTYYNCKRQCLAENNKKNIIDYYVKMKKAHVFLYNSPEILEAKLEYKPSVKIGVTMLEEVKDIAIEYTITFLNKYSTHLFSKDLLQELLLYNRNNSDRVSALLMLILMIEEADTKQKKSNVSKTYVTLPMYTFQNGTLKEI